MLVLGCRNQGACDRAFAEKIQHGSQTLQVCDLVGCRTVSKGSKAEPVLVEAHLSPWHLQNIFARVTWALQ